MTLRKSLQLLLIAGLIALAALQWLDSSGERFGNDAFQRALLTAAAARALNGVISVAQGTDVAIEPGGVGVNFGVGQILDPVNDLVERFSAVMLVAATSLGVQNILLDVSAWWGTSALMIFSAIPALLCLFRPELLTAGWRRFWIRWFTVTVVVRFAVPIFVILSNLIFNTFLEAEQSAALAALESTTVEVETLNQQQPEVTTEDSSLLERLGSALDDSLAAINVAERLERFKQAIRGASDHVINLIIIFVLQTILLPLAFLRLLLAAFNALVRFTSSH